MKPNFCSACGFQLREVKKYCSNCGNNLGTSLNNEVLVNIKSENLEIDNVSNTHGNSFNTEISRKDNSNGTILYKKWWIWAGLIFFLGLISGEKDVFGLCFFISSFIAFINGIIRPDGWLREIFLKLGNSKHWKVISVIIFILMIILRILHTIMKGAH
jgi:hypothetical protein